MKRSLFLLLLTLTACSAAPVDPLEYQENAFYAHAHFCDGDEEFYADVHSFGDGSIELTIVGGILDGVKLSCGENGYISKGNISVPFENVGENELLSMFSIDGEDLYSSERTDDGELFIYIKNENSRKYELYTENGLPKRIIYDSEDRHLICEIDEISAE